MACEHQSEASELRETDINVTEEVKLQWEKKQEKLKQRLSLEDGDIIKKLLTDWDTDKLASNKEREFYIGGVDLSFVKNDNINACAAIVIVRFPELQLVYEYCTMVELTAPYIPGYLAFREYPFILELLDQLMKEKPCYYPQLLMVDGNGILHPREFGLACHLGVLREIPSIGIAKKLFQVDGLVKDDRHHEKIKNLKKGGDTFKLMGSSGKILGMALRSCDSTKNPVYVSPGHKISVESAVKLVHRCCQHRVPEPIRLADIKSREYIRANFITEDKAHQSEVKKHKSHQKKNGRVEKISKSEKNYKSDSDGDLIIENSLGLLFVPRLQHRVNIAHVIFRFVYDSIRHTRPLVQLIMQFLNNFHEIW